MNILIVVDMQNDFIDGALGTAEAVAIVPAVAEKIRSFPGRVIFTRDTHPETYLSTQEGHHLPVTHCVRGSAGWALADAIEQARDEKTMHIFDKPTFGSTALAEALQALNALEPIEAIELCGLCTDICVISNALLLKAFLPEVPIRVDAACCAGVTPESHENALRAMKMCQIEIEGEEQ